MRASCASSPAATCRLRLRTRWLDMPSKLNNSRRSRLPPSLSPGSASVLGATRRLDTEVAQGIGQQLAARRRIRTLVQPLNQARGLATRQLVLAYRLGRVRLVGLSGNRASSRAAIDDNSPSRLASCSALSSPSASFSRRHTQDLSRRAADRPPLGSDGARGTARAQFTTLLGCVAETRYSGSSSNGRASPTTPRCTSTSSQSTPIESGCEAVCSRPGIIVPTGSHRKAFPSGDPTAGRRRGGQGRVAASLLADPLRPLRRPGRRPPDGDARLLPRRTRHDYAMPPWYIVAATSASPKSRPLVHLAAILGTHPGRR